MLPHFEGTAELAELTEQADVTLLLARSSLGEHRRPLQLGPVEKLNIHRRPVSGTFHVTCQVCGAIARNVNLRKLNQLRPTTHPAADMPPDPKPERP